MRWRVVSAGPGMSRLGSEAPAQNPECVRRGGARGEGYLIVDGRPQPHQGQHLATPAAFSAPSLTPRPLPCPNPTRSLQRTQLDTLLYDKDANVTPPLVH